MLSQTDGTAYVLYVALVFIYRFSYRKRVSLDNDTTESHCQKERIRRKQRRIRQSSTLLEASRAFTSSMEEGQHYVCMCCNRLMYHKTVQQFQVSNYDKVPSDFVVPESISAPTSIVTFQKCFLKNV